MITKGRFLIVASAAAVAMTATSATAAVSVDVATDAPVSGQTYTTFNSSALGTSGGTTATGVTYAFSGNGQVASGSASGPAPNYYQAPTINGGANFGQSDGTTDTTNYLSSGIGSVTLTFASPVSYFGLLWGSIDTYNTLTFNTTSGTQSFTGTDILTLLGAAPPAGTGSTSSGTQSRYINFFSSSNITSVVASSTNYSFEVENVSTGVPEPAAWAMMMIGFGAVGYAMRRRQKMTVRASYAR